MADQQRNKSNSYFAKQNHIAVKKAEVTKPLILDAAVQRASALGKTIASNVDGGWTVEEAATGPAASGGIETVITPAAGEFYRVHTFLSSGTLTVNQEITDVEFLVVGGGASGELDWSSSGGGDAGEFKMFVSGDANNTEASALTLSAGDVSIVVGAGGAARGLTDNGPGLDGTSSSIGALVVSAGGVGRSTPDTGGAGAGEVPSPPAEGGGDGLPSDITGTSTYYAGGGGSGRFNAGGDGGAGGGGVGGAADGGAIGGQHAGPGEANTGGGSGGGIRNGGDPAPGGSGIVVVRYEITEAEYLAEAA